MNLFDSSTTRALITELGSIGHQHQLCMPVQSSTAESSIADRVHQKQSPSFCGDPLQGVIKVCLGAIETKLSHLVGVSLYLHDAAVAAGSSITPGVTLTEHSFYYRPSIAPRLADNNSAPRFFCLLRGVLIYPLRVHTRAPVAGVVGGRGP